METAQTTASSNAHDTPKYKLHWHVLFTHFPVGAFSGAFLFMALHAITRDRCYGQAAYVSLLAGLFVLIPTTATGWVTWKRKYKGFKNKLFRIKIWTSFAMIPICAALVAYQTLHPFTVLEVSHRWEHALYFVGVSSLLFGSFLEGFWGGRLHHR